MIPYSVGLVIAFVFWLMMTTSLSEEAKSRPHDAKAAKKARLAWLSSFLLPLYPAVVVVAVLAIPIINYRQLGRLNKEKE